MKGLCTFTFDDGPDLSWTPKVLAELDRCEVRATFFVIGEYLADHPELAQIALHAGHDVQLHCNRHVRHTELSDRALEADTIAVLHEFERAGLPRPRRWRPPWGVSTAATVRVAGALELELVHWTIDTHDWRGDSSAEMLERAEDALEHGAVVLMHDGLGPGARRTGADQTVGLIAPLCEAARARDLEVGPLSHTALPPLAGARL